jgi:hypothetical protein
MIVLDGPRRRFREPSATFVDHTLAATQLVVDLTIAAKTGKAELLVVECEPSCWRSFSTSGGRQTLRPDLFIAVGVGAFEHRYFVEIDRATEHVTTVLAKCRIYEAYYRSGREQSKHQVFPKVCWVVPSERRAKQLIQNLRADKRLTASLFHVVTADRAAGQLGGGHI